MGSNVMGLGGGALAATIIVTILFFAANDQSCADAAAGVNKSNRTNMANFHFDHNDMFSEDDSELQLAAAVPRTTTLNVGIAAKQVIDCARPGPYKPCTPDPQNSKKAEHCSLPPGGLYLNRGCAH